MTEIIYSPESPLASPRAFGRAVLADIKAVFRIGWQLFVRNLVVQYRQSVLGYLWLLLPPLVLALVWTVLGRAQVLRTQALAVPFPVYVLAGVFLWQGFVEALNGPLQQLSAVRHTLAKVRVPHEAFVVAGMGVVVFNLAIRLAVLVVAMWWFEVPFRVTLALVPLGAAALLALGLALGWGVAVLGMLYSDIGNGLSVGVNLWFLITPVVYVLPGHYARYFNLNPVTPLLTTTRNWLLLGALPPAPGFWTVAALASMGVALGWLAYRLAQPHLVVRL
ncbi:ABC transporter permease [Hymenobacter busanensis]|uniref:ABC transporter permease n=1 Tax=Hymenobacter busanensis TaxID=2607656 RepID=A0A7L5A0M3_9BACT|nr:ABC transporter permease [Hymenobacter busanensis]KAA9333359.1 ABC transporter permease [Hymenobacter busanensis]QHJ07962.1 ABC transporter permease [Hymenobacter busanensis]